MRKFTLDIRALNQGPFHLMVGKVYLGHAWLIVYLTDAYFEWPNSVTYIPGKWDPHSFEICTKRFLQKKFLFPWEYFNVIFHQYFLALAASQNYLKILKITMFYHKSYFVGIILTCDIMVLYVYVCVCTMCLYVCVLYVCVFIFAYVLLNVEAGA